MRINTPLNQKFILLQQYKKTATKNGRANKVNAILIEKISGRRRLGKVYKPFPTKKRSRYVPSKEASNIAGINCEIL